jgi:hypothetical protein
MQVKEIKNKIQLAIQAVADVEEPFKTKAFEVVLSRLLEKPEVKGRPSPNQIALKEAKTWMKKLQDLQKKPIWMWISLKMFSSSRKTSQYL